MMRLRKTHSHTSERLGYEARKNIKKPIEGKRRRYDKANHRQKPTADRQRGGGGETKKGDWRNAGAMIRDTNVKTLPRTASVAGGRDEERRKLTRNGKVAQPAVPRGVEVPSWKRTTKQDKITCITKKIKQNNTQSCATVWVARLPWPPPPARGWGGCRQDDDAIYEGHY